MNKYFWFRKLMDLVTDDGEVTDADMDNYAGDIKVFGTGFDGSTIEITVRITEAKKEDETHGN